MQTKCRHNRGRLAGLKKKNTREDIEKKLLEIKKDILRKEKRKSEANKKRLAKIDEVKIN